MQVVLQELAGQVRRGTVRALGAVDQACLLWAPQGTRNHMIWHVGHALWLQDVLCVGLLTGSEQLPTEWGETFGARCRSPAETSDWPDREKLTGMLEQQLEQMIELLGGASDEKLLSVADASRGTATIADRIIHGLHDEARHTGEMHLLAKLWRVSSQPAD